MIDIIEDRKSWDLAISQSNRRDFYHSYEYHQASSLQDEKPVLLFYSQNHKTGVLLPLLVRQITGFNWNDATSVYGYAGPVFIGDQSSVDSNKFKIELTDTLSKMEIVSVFSRLHPFIPGQEDLLQKIGQVEHVGNVVNIDIQKEPDEQWSATSKRFRTYINKARRTYTVREAQNESDLESFIQLYENTMRRLRAKSHYFFEKSYYERLFKSRNFRTEILLAEDPESNTIVSGAMFISCCNIVQYHLSGTHKDYLKLHPVKLLINQMREKATARGMDYFNLGGGLGGARDSLFEFKSRFSKDFRKFRVWKFISNKNVYESLAQKYMGDICVKNYKTCKEFFPCYRCSLPNS